MLVGSQFSKTSVSSLVWLCASEPLEGSQRTDWARAKGEKSAKKRRSAKGRVGAYLKNECTESGDVRAALDKCRSGGGVEANSWGDGD